MQRLDRSPSSVVLLKNTPTGAKALSAPKFSGVADDLKSNREAYEHQLFVKYIERNRNVLNGTVLTVGDKKITGFELMQFMQEVQRGNRASFWRDLAVPLYPPAEVATNYSALYAAVEKLVGTEAMTWKWDGTFWDTHHQKDYKDITLEFTPKGLQLLKEAELVKKAGKSGKSSDTVSVNSSSAKEQELVRARKFERVRLLMNSKYEDQTGWMVMRRLQEIDGSRFFLGRLFSPGIKTDALAAVIQPEDKQGFNKQLDAMSRVGLLEKRQKGASVRWILTTEAKEMLKMADPMEACAITQDDMKHLMQGEISNLETEKKKRQNQLDSLEENMKQSILSMVQLQAQYDGEKQAALETYDKIAQTPDESEKQKIKLQAAEKAFNAELLESKIKLKKEWNARLNLQIESAKVVFSNWHFQTHQRIKALQESLIQLETAEVNNNIMGLLKEMQVIEAQQHAGNENMNAVLTAIMGNIQGDYHRTQAALEMESPGQQITSGQQVYNNYLDSAISKLKGKEGAAPSSATEKTPLSVLTPDKAAEEKTKAKTSS